MEHAKKIDAAELAERVTASEESPPPGQTRDEEWLGMLDHETETLRSPNWWPRGWGIPERHRAPGLSTFDSLLQRDPGGTYGAAIETLRRMPADGFVALVGKRGVGKTQAACTTLAELGRAAQRQRIARRRAEIKREPVEAKTKRTGCYVRAYDLLGELKARLGGRNRAFDEEVARVSKEVDLLVIDEVQETARSEWEAATMTSILDARYAHRKATILISNLQPTEFATAVGASVVSRIQETGRVVECVWGSFRQRREWGDGGLLS